MYEHVCTFAVIDAWNYFCCWNESWLILEISLIKSNIFLTIASLYRPAVPARWMVNWFKPLFPWKPFWLLIHSCPIIFLSWHQRLNKDWTLSQRLSCCSTWQIINSSPIQSIFSCKFRSHALTRLRKLKKFPSDKEDPSHSWYNQGLALVVFCHGVVVCGLASKWKRRYSTNLIHILNL